MLCPNCRKQNGFIARFCQHCGRDLQARSYADEHPSYAGFWRRLTAYAIDHFLVYVGMGLGLFVMGLMFSPPILGWRGFWDHGLILAPLAPWLYWSIMESSPHQATFGKAILGLKVTDYNGKRISFARATVRYWSKLLSSLLLLGGFLMIGFTARKEGLHDVIAGTLVVRR